MQGQGGDLGSENRRDWEPWLWATVFVGLFVYAWVGIQTHLLYCGFGVFTAYPVFSWERSFLRDAFSTPGGALNAFAALLAQLYRSPPAGAAVIVAISGVLFAGIRRLLHAMGAQRIRDLAWAPVILALMIYHRYDDPLPVLLAVGLSVWMAVLYAAIPMKTSASRAGVFLALFVPAYYLTGASALVFAAVICLTKGLLHRRPMVAVALAALAGGAVLVLGGLVFGLEPRAAYAAGTPWDSGHGRDFAPLSGSLVVVLYAFVPGLVLTAFLGRLLAPLWTRKARPTKDAGRWTAHHRAWIGVRLFVVCLTAVLCLALSPSHVRNERMLHYHVLQRDWSRAIALGHRMRRKGTFTRSAVFDINRALAHEGRLGEELCAYPQDETRTLFLSFDDMAGRFQHAKLIELYLDLGCPNAAEKNAYELLDNEGPSPHVLEALVRIHLVKGQYESARVAFGALQRYAGGRESARQWREVVADPARARDHPLLHAWRRVQGTDDQAVGGIAFEPMLKSLLHDTPGHRLAFEYLMAHYLLKHQRAEFARWLPLLKPLGYDRLPRHYAEAVLVHALETRTPPNAQGWPIEPDVQSRFREISAIVRSARGNNQAVFDTLAPRFGDTYTFYSLFNVCGVK